MDTSGSRRDFLTGVAVAPLAGAATLAAAASAGATGPDTAVALAFDRMVQALSDGKLEAFYGAMHERFQMIDEDSPWRMSKTAFKEHISFHIGGVWDSFAWLPVSTTARAFGRTGVVAGTAMFRGKPKDAGFRLRPLLFSQAWVQADAGWQLLNWHQSPIVGLVSRASPT